MLVVLEVGKVGWMAQQYKLSFSLTIISEHDDHNGFGRELLVEVSVTFYNQSKGLL